MTKYGIHNIDACLIIDPMYDNLIAKPMYGHFFGETKAFRITMTSIVSDYIKLISHYNHWYYVIVIIY